MLHRVWQMLAMNELEISAPITPVAQTPKYNSTSSLYIDSTITRPCIDEIIFCVSIVIHDRIEEGEREVRRRPCAQAPASSSFDHRDHRDHVHRSRTTRRSTTSCPVTSTSRTSHSCCSSTRQIRRRTRSSNRSNPSTRSPNSLVRCDEPFAPASPALPPPASPPSRPRCASRPDLHLAHRSDAPDALPLTAAECLVISLLYIERLRSLTGLHLLESNWQPILLAAMVVAQKVWDDKSLLNVDFSLICSAYSLKDINQLEKQARRRRLHVVVCPFCSWFRLSSDRSPPILPVVACPSPLTCLLAASPFQFLEMLQYNVSISASLYASYYFELRTLCEKAERNFSLKPLSDEEVVKLEARSEGRTEYMQESTRRWQSLGTGLNPTPM